MARMHKIHTRFTNNKHKQHKTNSLKRKLYVFVFNSFCLYIGSPTINWNENIHWWIYSFVSLFCSNTSILCILMCVLYMCVVCTQYSHLSNRFLFLCFLQFLMQVPEVVFIYDFFCSLAKWHLKIWIK